MTTTNYTQDTEYLALLEAIRTSPADDAPRLIIADWLEEHGGDERAEFIRVQIGLTNHIKQFEAVRSKHGDYYHMPDRYREDLERKIELLWGTYPSKNDVRYAIIGCLPKFGDDFKLVLPDHMDGSDCKAVVHRGFISEIRLSCREFMGGRCGNCNDRGEVYVFAGPESHWGKCDKCNGNKIVPGVARELFERHPLTRIVLTDKKPLIVNAMESHDSVSFVWFSGPTLSQTSPNHLPDPMSYHCRAFYKSEAAALDALSDACVAYGRSLANLPPLP